MEDLTKVIEVEITMATITEVKPSFKGLTGGWSKYGGKRHSIAYNQHGLSEVDDQWACQSCGQRQPHDLSPYLYEYPEAEYIRVCSVCLVDGCSTLKSRLSGL